MYGTDEAGEGDLLEFVVDEVTDGVGEGEARRSGRQGGPIDFDGHLHGFCVLEGRGGERKGEKDWFGRRGCVYIRRVSPENAICRRRRHFLSPHRAVQILASHVGEGCCSL